MNDRRLRNALRRALFLSLSVPLAGAGIGCGGRALVTEGEDSGTPPEGTDSGAIEDARTLPLPMPKPVPPPPTMPGPRGCAPGPILDGGAPGACGGFDVVLLGNPIDCTRAPGGSQLSADTCTRFCSGQTTYCTAETSPQTGAPVVRCHLGCEGRRPEGLPATADVEGTDEVGRLFARAAYLEAASVDAFQILRDELTAHGAPQKLIDAAARAAEDEVRHAKMMGALARRFGASVVLPTVAARPLRSLEAIALENEVEGCVRETYGALLAAFQARESSDPVVRAAMARIAEDETRHAELGWRVSAWATKRLGAAGKKRLAAARAEAVETLAREIDCDPPPALLGSAGLPSAARARALVGSLRASVWA